MKTIIKHLRKILFKKKAKAAERNEKARLCFKKLIGFLEYNTYNIGPFCHVSLQGNTLVVVTHRPGLLIGRGGRTIDEVKRMMSEQMEEPIEIKIIEATVLGDWTI